jgi:hypothetical protein
MTQDDNEVVMEEPVEPTEPQEPVEPAEPQEPQEDYRGKLNATNSFLKKEGYVFDEAKKQWVKPSPSAPRENSPSPDLSNLEKRVVKAELAAAGITHAEDQEFVLGAAKRLGVDPAEAASDPLVAGKLEAMREARKTKEATPTPSRVGQSSTNVTRLAEKALSSGELPTDPALRAKVKEEMKRISKT